MIALVSILAYCAHMGPARVSPRLGPFFLIALRACEKKNGYLAYKVHFTGSHIFLFWAYLGVTGHKHAHTTRRT
jgi:hypothetical protein